MNRRGREGPERIKREGRRERGGMGAGWLPSCAGPWGRRAERPLGACAVYCSSSGFTARPPGHLFPSGLRPVQLGLTAVALATPLC